MTKWNNLNHHSRLRDLVRNSIVNIISHNRQIEKECKRIEDELKELTPPAIQVKDIDVLRALLSVPYDPILIDLIAWIEKEFGHMLLITEGYRENDDGVHGTIPCRGIDIRDRIYDDPEYVVDEINKNWGYDPDRPGKPCAVWHDTGKGWHLHIQTHPNTYLKEVT